MPCAHLSHSVPVSMFLLLRDITRAHGPSYSLPIQKMCPSCIGSGLYPKDCKRLCTFAQQHFSGRQILFTFTSESRILRCFAVTTVTLSWCNLIRCSGHVCRLIKLWMCDFSTRESNPSTNGSRIVIDCRVRPSCLVSYSLQSVLRRDALVFPS